VNDSQSVDTWVADLQRIVHPSAMGVAQYHNLAGSNSCSHDGRARLQVRTNQVETLHSCLACGVFGEKLMSSSGNGSMRSGCVELGRSASGVLRLDVGCNDSMLGGRPDCPENVL
jgi:hypothetical protein